MTKLNQSDWRIEPCDDNHVLISVYESNGYRHWIKVKI